MNMKNSSTTLFLVLSFLILVIFCVIKVYFHVFLCMWWGDSLGVFSIREIAILSISNGLVPMTPWFQQWFLSVHEPYRFEHCVKTYRLDHCGSLLQLRPVARGLDWMPPLWVAPMCPTSWASCDVNLNFLCVCLRLSLEICTVGYLPLFRIGALTIWSTACIWHHIQSTTSIAENCIFAALSWIRVGAKFLTLHDLSWDCCSDRWIGEGVSMFCDFVWLRAVRAFSCLRGPHM